VISGRALKTVEIASRLRDARLSGAFAVSGFGD
jgi:hypothetical protein